MDLAAFLQLFFGLLATVITVAGLWYKYKFFRGIFSWLQPSSPN